jgi:hypothetical protein
MNTEKIELTHESDGTWWCEINEIRYYAPTRAALIQGLKKHLHTTYLTHIGLIEE